MNKGIQGVGGSVEAEMMKTLMKKQLVVLINLANHKVLSLLFFEAIEIFFYIDFSTFANKMTM